MKDLKKIKTLLFICLFILSIITFAKSATTSAISPYVSNAFHVSDTILHQIISKGGAAGDYQAFPDVARLQNGDIIVTFYAGDGHVTYSSDKYPKAGRICIVRSTDEGKTWSKPQIVFDGEHDDRDPHVTQLNDGTVVCTFFTLFFDGDRNRTGVDIQLVRSHDNGKTWDTESQKMDVESLPYYCSGQLRELSDGTLLFPVYYQKGSGRNGQKAWGGVLRSQNKGLDWSKVVTIGKEANLPLAAETDIIELRDGTLLAALRGQYEVDMHYATSIDKGKNWTFVKSFGFKGHAPSFTRLGSGEILLTYRGNNGGTGSWVKTGYTGLRISNDEGRTWQGPYMIDETPGAYSSTLELKDGNILAIYYEEGENSGVRAKKFRMPELINGSEFSTPQLVHAIPVNHDK